MKTIHGYDDTEKTLTTQQWNEATTEQRNGFLQEGYLVVAEETDNRECRSCGRIMSEREAAEQRACNDCVRG